MSKVAAVVLVGLLALGSVGFAEIGTRGNPITWVFPPSTHPGVIEEIATEIAEDIGQMTGLYIVPRVMPDYAALIEAFKAAEGDVMGTPTTDQYARISVETDFEASARLASVRYGYPYYYASIYAMRDSGIRKLEDLEGKVWIYNDEGSTSGYRFPEMLFENEGIEVADVVKSGGHTNTMIALVEEQGDFGTGYGSPPIPPEAYQDGLDEAGFRWEFGMDPELWVWDRWNEELYPEVIRGEIRDIRYAVAQTELYGDYWEIMEKVGIVDVIGPIPNDCIAFSPDFPEDFQDQIVQAIIDHISTEEGAELWGDPNFYEWDEVEEIDDSYYDNYRELVGLPNPER
ncbi:MAG: PhnD/SsuA/transferrin family substrate-binding protein [Candidatus Bipolaricaulota bacterium]